MFRMLFLQVGVYSEAKACKTVVLMQDLLVVTVTENVLTKHVQATFQYYESIRAWDDYKTACGREHLEVERQREIVVAEHLKEFDVRRVVDREKTVWSWYLLYHMCATNHHLKERLLPFLWSHFINKPVNIPKAFFYERTPSLT